MGNRGTIVFTDREWREFSPAVYLHWNGGPESVYAFLDELDRRQCRADQFYEVARFTQIIGDFFDQTAITNLSLGVTNGPESVADILIGNVKTDLGDNGLYLISRERGPDDAARVRRFVMDWEKVKTSEYKKHFMRELSPDEVRAEKAQAYIDNPEYKDGIAETFQAMTKDKKLEPA
jgi:hypothetical protein